MTFLNSILLAGAAAFLIPLIIHLLNRRRIQVVRWGPMHLLAEVLRQKKRRLQIEQWLLLLMRIAIPIVLALCLARPVMSALRALPGFGKTSLVILLDDSFSMKAAGSQGAAWDRAKEAVGRIVTNLPRGSDVQVVLGGGRPRNLLPERTSSLDLIAPALNDVTAASGPVNVEDAVKHCSALIAKAPNATRELMIVSDFQGTDWRVFTEGASLPSLDELKKNQPAPAVSFYKVENDVQENLSLASVELSAVAAAETQPVGIRVRVKNHGTRLWQDVALHLEADGARLRTTRISVPGEGETTLSLTHSFDKVGDHTLGVRLDGDGPAEDNVWTGVVQVRQQVNVLLVENEMGGAALSDGADFAELALAPHLAAAAGIKDLFATSRADHRRLREQDLKGKEVIILCDVERLPRVTDLERFVQAGGGLLIFGGPHTDIRRINSEGWRDGKGLLPAELKGLAHTEAGQRDARVLLQRFSHPALSYFNDPRAGKLSDADFRTWWKVELVHADTKPIALLDSNTPLIVEKALGKGKVVMINSTASPEWNNLPLQGVWVPLMQRLTSYLATRGTGGNAGKVGDSIRLGIEDGKGDEVFTLTPPDGTPSEITARKESSGVTVESPPLVEPGVYQLAPKAGGDARKYAFNVDTTESDLKALTNNEVNSLGQRLGAEVVASVEDYQRLDRSRRFGTEIWQAVLLVLLLLLFGEVLLEQRISRA
ncbi:MAG: BatA domain-containing protein [Verrucomicrobiaceae bacterium]|nr:BatA domain-containing protein [Verrucomicrobiaceae bacterium]